MSSTGAQKPGLGIYLPGFALGCVLLGVSWGLAWLSIKWLAILVFLALGGITLVALVASRTSRSVARRTDLRRFGIGLAVPFGLATVTVAGSASSRC